MSKGRRFYIKIFFFIVITFTICYILLFINPDRPETYLRFERKFKLCKLPKHYKPLSYAPSEYRSCPKNGIVTVVQGGRLGNQIWEYASVWLIAKKTGLKPFVPSCIKASISILLDNLDIPIIEDIRNCTVENEGREIPATSHRWLPNKSLVLRMYATAPDLLVEYIDDINNIFTIKQSLLDKGREILLAGSKLLNLRVATYVGVHVRRGDFLKHLKVLHNLNPINITTHFKSSMAYFESKYPDPIFIVASDDPDWCFEAFGSKNNVYITDQYHDSSPELDMAVMASCNHSIIDYGTYGQWAALFAGGETLFYHLNDRHPSETFSRYFKKWHTLKEYSSGKNFG